MSQDINEVVPQTAPVVPADAAAAGQLAGSVLKTTGLEGWRKVIVLSMIMVFLMLEQLLGIHMNEEILQWAIVAFFGANGMEHIGKLKIFNKN